MTEEPRTGRQRRRLTATITDLEVVRQRAYLVSVAHSPGDVPESEASLAELALLTDTAGSEPVDTALVRRAVPDPGLFIGRGKAADLAAEVKALDIDVVVFDNDLSPAQQRNLQGVFECDVVDRVAVILDIFAQHASSREGMVQVELAQLRYRLPRLRGKGLELSRLGGGIGTRGPGETQLETDRRRIQNRITKLQHELRDLDGARETRGKARRKSDLPLIALVGYTNAGKSSLFNRLTAAGVLVEDRLFATVDSTVRQLELPSGSMSLVSDTVGFVRRLPHQLVEAFRSTLEEVGEADLLLHVVDASGGDPDRHIEAVRQVLREIDAGDIPEILVINKTDVADPNAVTRLLRLFEGSVAVSASTGEGIGALGESIASDLAVGTEEVELIVPYERGDVLAAVHRSAEVISQEHVDTGSYIKARLPRAEVARFAEWLLG